MINMKRPIPIDEPEVTYGVLRHPTDDVETMVITEDILYAIANAKDFYGEEVEIIIDDNGVLGVNL